MRKMNRKHRSAIALLLLLAGCAGPELQVPKEVRVPVPVPCIAAADRPERPPMASDAELLALDTYRRTWALWGDRAARQAYERELEAVVEGCGRIPAQISGPSSKAARTAPSR